MHADVIVAQFFWIPYSNRTQPLHNNALHVARRMHDHVKTFTAMGYASSRPFVPLGIASTYAL